MTSNISLLIDWSSASFGLRPNFPRSTQWNIHSDTVKEILLRIRTAVSRIPISREKHYLDTYLFGGFVLPEGSWTDQKSSLDSAIASVEWGGISSDSLAFRQINLVYRLNLNSGINRLPGLYRPNELIAEAHFSRSQDCGCSWRKFTADWLNRRYGARRICPQCESQGKSESAVLYHETEKLVDSLLTAYAFDHALTYLFSEYNDSKIWICSGDADFVPILSMLRRWGISCSWLQPFPNSSYGYAAMLASIGVGIYSLQDLLEED